MMWPTVKMSLTPLIWDHLSPSHLLYVTPPIGHNARVESLNRFQLACANARLSGVDFCDVFTLCNI